MSVEVLFKLSLTTKNVSGDSKNMTETMLGDGSRDTRGGNRRRPVRGGGENTVERCLAENMARAANLRRGECPKRAKYRVYATLLKIDEKLSN